MVQIGWVVVFGEEVQSVWMEITWSNLSENFRFFALLLGECGIINLSLFKFGWLVGENKIMW